MLKTMCLPTQNTRSSPKIITPSISHRVECKTRAPILHHQRTSFVLPIRRRAFQKVRFAPSLASKDSEPDSKNVFASPHKELTEEMVRTTWYAKRDILNFQKRSKLLILLKSKFPTLPVGSKINESTLGLDRFNPKRAAYKRAAMKFTLHAQQQQKTDDSDFLAAVAQKCSAWARSDAIHQALRNYCDVYNHSKEEDASLCAMVKRLQQQNQQSSSLASSNKGTKRSFEGDDEEPRQKRRRVAPRSA